MRPQQPQDNSDEDTTAADSEDEARWQAQELEAHLDWLAAVTPPTADPRPILTRLARSLPNFLPALTPAPSHSQPTLLQLPDTALAIITAAAGPSARATCRALRAAAPPLTHLCPHQPPQTSAPSSWCDPPEVPAPLPLPPTLLAPLTSLSLTRLRHTADDIEPILAAAAAHCTALRALTLPPTCLGPLPLHLPTAFPAASLAALHTLTLGECSLNHPADLAPLSLLTALRALSLHPTCDLSGICSLPAASDAAAMGVLDPILCLSLLTSLHLQFVQCEPSDDSDDDYDNAAINFEHQQCRLAVIMQGLVLKLAKRIPSALPHLSHLDIHPSASLAAPSILSELATMTGLASLHASNVVPFCDPDSFFGSVAALPHLSSLSLEVDLESLEALPTLTQRPSTLPPSRLRSITLSVDQSAIGIHAEAPVCLLTQALAPTAANLTHLSLASAFTFNEPDLHSLAAAAPALRSLSLIRVRLPLSFYPALAALTALTHLSVRNCNPVNPHGLPQLTSLRNLELLSSVAEELQPGLVAAKSGGLGQLLAAIRHLTGLTRLRLEMVGMETSGEHPWQLLPLEQLQELELSGYDLLGPGCVFSPCLLAALLHLRGLRWFHHRCYDKDAADNSGQSWHVEDLRDRAAMLSSQHWMNVRLQACKALGGQACCCALCVAASAYATTGAADSPSSDTA